MPEAYGRKTRENRKKTRRENWIEPLEEKIYIFCEGEQTEPLYFEAFETAIEKNPIYKNAIEVHVEGVGKETLRVVKAAVEYIQKNKLNNAQIWCVYDKDSFPQRDFNEAENAVKSLNKKLEEYNNTYHAAWSNECIEYWFVLHFSNYTSNNTRDKYIEHLDNQFAKFGLGKYQKNNDENFDILLKYGNPKNAIKWATEQLKNFEGVTPSKSAPATKVHSLVLSLAKYLPEDMKKRFIENNNREDE